MLWTIQIGQFVIKIQILPPPLSRIKTRKKDFFTYSQEVGISSCFIVVSHLVWAPGVVICTVIKSRRSWFWAASVSCFV